MCLFKSETVKRDYFKLNLDNLKIRFKLILSLFSLFS
jgi:hypothetical protein